MTIEEIKNLSLKQLTDPAVLSKLEETAEDSMYETEAHEARGFYEVLDRIYREHLQSLEAYYPDAYNKINYILDLLFWKAFVALPTNIKSKSLASNLVVYSLKKGIDIKFYLKKYLDIFEYKLGPDVVERQKFLYALGHNQETIGDQPLNLRTDAHALPTIENWIKDFSTYLPVGFIGSKFEQISYLNNSQNVVKLSGEDKAVLAKILDLYVWLKYPKVEDRPELRKQTQWQSTASPAPKPLPRPVVLPPSKAANPVPAPQARSGLSIEKLKTELSASARPELKKPASPNILKPQMTPSEIKAPSQGESSRSALTPEEIKPPSLVQPHAGAGHSLPEGESYAEEIKREVETPELPAHGNMLDGSAARTRLPREGEFGGQARNMEHVTGKEIASSQAPRNDSSLSSRAAESRVAISPKINTLDDIKFVDDLKKVSAAYLRLGPLSTQISNLKSRIAYLAQANRLYPHEVVKVFEQSPLFRAYLAQGSAKVVGAPIQGELSQAEFEAVADLKKEIERM